MGKTIYIDGLGYRNPISDKDQIIWFFEQAVKTKPKAVATRYWLDLKEGYTKSLLKMEAFELLAYIMDKTTAEQEKRRTASRKKSKEKAEKEMEAFKDWYDQYKTKHDLINKVQPN